MFERDVLQYSLESLAQPYPAAVTWHRDKHYIDDKHASNHNHNYVFPDRSVSFSLRDKFDEGFFPSSMGGSSRLANLPTLALPFPSYPARFRQDNTYAWTTAYG